MIVDWWLRRKWTAVGDKEKSVALRRTPEFELAQEESVQHIDIKCTTLRMFFDFTNASRNFSGGGSLDAICLK